MDGQTVASVARQHELNPSMLFAWRKQYRQVSTFPASPEPIGFAPAIIAPAERQEPRCLSEAPLKHAPVIELDFESGARLRIFDAADLSLSHDSARQVDTANEQFKIIKQQLDEMRRTSNDNVALQRAQIVLSKLSLKTFGETEDRGRVWYIGPIWENSGNTIAINVRAATHHLAFKPEEKSYSFPKFSNHETKKGTTIAAHQQSLGYFAKISGGQLNAVSDHILSEYVTSVVSYDDIFGNHRVTMTCNRITLPEGVDFDASLSEQSLGAEACDEFNCVDDGCLQYKDIEGIPEGVFPIGPYQKLNQKPTADRDTND